MRQAAAAQEITAAAARSPSSGEPQPGLGVGEQPAQVVMGRKRRERGDLRRDGPRIRRDEREQATLDHGTASRGEDQPSVPKEALGGKFRAHMRPGCGEFRSLFQRTR
jgi:hypothetical protein